VKCHWCRTWSLNIGTGCEILTRSWGRAREEKQEEEEEEEEKTRKKEEEEEYWQLKNSNHSNNWMLTLVRMIEYCATNRCEM
jgi:hypothetical protein